MATTDIFVFDDPLPELHERPADPKTQGKMAIFILSRDGDGKTTLQRVWLPFYLAEKVAQYIPCSCGWCNKPTL